MEVLLEVVAQREVEERSPVRRQLHARRQPTLHHREVARGVMPVELVDVRAHLQALVLGQRAWIDPRACDDDHPQRRHSQLRLREGLHHPPQ